MSSAQSPPRRIRSSRAYSFSSVKKLRRRIWERKKMRRSSCCAPAGRCAARRLSNGGNPALRTRPTPRHGREAAPVDPGLDVPARQGADVRQMLLDEPPVRPQELGQVDLGVVNQKTEPLADELLGHEHQRALAQVVGPGLERQSDHAYAALAARQDLGDGMV